MVPFLAEIVVLLEKYQEDHWKRQRKSRALVVGSTNHPLHVIPELFQEQAHILIPITDPCQ